ncbi:GntP family permease, putative gluconate transporter [Campylobacter blaseri]|uniref:Gluconate transporter n=1 Tax=Campylobacter blaseri TaxID=2042961 RepID=A0A2P8R419_9BACT|nr:GntP family permease [Campylobacter blaseri]PSM53252.1 gluconate transporter [Campylobacter blaseri]PSM54718.1 gluconate transporter [Campylobacter blaseri]QKF86798.1 GntP family permease, putative gluconate transporter [Campylobacter blaseri]
MSGIVLIVCFVIAIILMIWLISRVGVHPFIAIMLISLLLAIVAGIDLVKIPGIIGDGFSGIFKSIGIVIIFGALIGMALEKTGAALKLADMVVKCIGEKHPEMAMLIMGWIVGIPVFCDSGFVVLDPIRRAIREKIHASPVGMAVALSGGLYTSHVFVPPTPGPIAAAGLIGVGGNLLLVIIIGVVVSIPVLIAAYLYARYIGNKITLKDETNSTQKSYDELIKEYGKLPSSFLSLAPIFAPIILMALGSIVKIAGLKGAIANFLLFLGSPVIALGIGVVFAVWLLFDTGKIKEFNAMTNETLKLVGPILFITAAGGVLGKVITAAGFVEFMKANAHIIGSVGIFFPFLISAIIKTAQGSSTVALTTTASIMGLFTDQTSMMTALGLTTQMGAALTVMAIAAGAMTVSHANDSYFWVVTNFSEMTPEQGYKTQTTLTLIMGIVGIITVWIASLILL